MNKFTVYFATDTGEGAGFKTVNAASITSALEWGVSQLEPAKEFPAEPVATGSHLDAARHYEWRKECTRIAIWNKGRRASVRRINVEDFFPASRTV